jgi:hypothetical protein
MKIGERMSGVGGEVGEVLRGGSANRFAMNWQDTWRRVMVHLETEINAKLNSPILVCLYEHTVTASIIIRDELRGVECTIYRYRLGLALLMHIPACVCVHIEIRLYHHLSSFLLLLLSLSHHHHLSQSYPFYLNNTIVLSHTLTPPYYHNSSYESHCNPPLLSQSL